jgi:hypothetical protein
LNAEASDWRGHNAIALCISVNSQEPATSISSRRMGLSMMLVPLFQVPIFSHMSIFVLQMESPAITFVADLLTPPYFGIFTCQFVPQDVYVDLFVHYLYLIMQENRLKKLCPSIFRI